MFPLLTRKELFGFSVFWALLALIPLISFDADLVLRAVGISFCLWASFLYYRRALKAPKK
jgi:hypothetical protein